MNGGSSRSDESLVDFDIANGYEAKIMNRKSVREKNDEFRGYSGEGF